jgi:hypothetical protein
MIMAALSKPRTKKLELPFNVEKRDIEIPFVTKDGSICRRSVRLYLPDNAPMPMPLVFIAHYEVTESDAMLKMYLMKGWAVASPINFLPEYNVNLIDDDLVFNSAALTAVRKQPDIDPSRIVVTGGSAGGYMALMLSILHLGICCTVSIVGITNVVYNMKYLDHAHSYNQEVLSKLSPEERKDTTRLAEILPIPIVGFIADMFTPNYYRIEQHPDPKIGMVLSPSCMTGCFTNPVLFTHFTSDALVPVEQLTRRFGPAVRGESLPKDFRISLSEFDLPEELQKSLAETLPCSELAEYFIPAPTAEGENIAVPFDLDKRFNIVVYDEGPVEAHAGHQKNLLLGPFDAIPYMEAQLNRTYRRTNWLTEDKLALMAQRYQGKSLLVPWREGVDDSVYGSMSTIRREILDELSWFVKECAEEFTGICERLKNRRPDLEAALDEIASKVIDKTE